MTRSTYTKKEPILDSSMKAKQISFLFFDYIVMTREIEFRAWDKETKTMIINSTTCIYLNWNIEWKRPRILMQRTWLKDKNGVKIFEGDIVRCWRSYIYEIKRQEASAWFMFYNTDHTFFWPEYERRSPFTREAFSVYDYKVIWNIYENPSLLSKDTDE